MRNRGGLLANFGLAVLAVVLFLALVEGLASAVLFARSLLAEGLARPSVAERTHTRYDAELGWVNIPNVSVPDLYGPGASLHTNAQGFRGNRDTPEAVPEGVFRIICSGDSFTLGFGVADDQTWCHLLALAGRRVETVNMGQGGYGIDQAWLWYRRDGAHLEHQLQVFAFVYPDITRMTQLEFLRYAKPRVRYRGGAFQIENTPVPQAGVLHGWLRRNRDTFGSLRLFQLMGPLVGRPLPKPDYERFAPYSQEEAIAVAIEIFGDVQHGNAAQGSRAVVAYLTSWLDLRDKPVETQRFRDDFSEQMAELGIPFFDLTDDFRGLDAALLETLFIKAGETPFRHATGHYTAAGNAFVASLLSRRLDALLGPPAPTGLP